MSRSPGSRFVNFILHFVFFLSGIATVLIGQVLPIFARHFLLSDLQASYFFPAQFAGSLAGTYFTHRLAKRNNFLAAAIVGGLLIGAGMLLMNAGLFSICLIGFLVNGIGIGMSLPSINMLILEASPERSASALNLLNFCWGVGAIVSKPFVDLCSTPDNIGPTTMILAVPMVLSSMMLWVASGGTKAPAPKIEAQEASNSSEIWRMPVAWMIALFNFIHVGFESGIGGWLTTYTGRVEDQPIVHWISPTLLYFTFFVLGRGVAPVLCRFLNENRMLMLGLLIVLAGMVLTLSAGTVISLSLGAAVAGFGTSWVFPTNISRFSSTFGPAASRNSTPLFISGTLGAATSTWAIGFISDQTGSLHVGMYLLVLSVLLLIVLQTALSREPTKSVK